ncbi:MAG: hypothetical protein ABRQ39_17760 [Candidatus Eremiobacterota bacterium]
MLYKLLSIILLLFFMSLMPVCSKEEAEPNNTMDKANSISSGDTVTGHTGIETQYGLMGDMDIFCLPVKYPGKLTVYASVTGKFGNTAGESSIRVDILNKDELKTGEWKDPSSGKEKSPVCTGNITRTITVQKPGNIYILVDRYGEHAYYKVKIVYEEKGNNKSETLSSAVSEAEPNDTPSSAMKLALKQPVVGHTGLTGKYGLQGNRDYYTVEVPYPGKLTVYLNIEGRYGEGNMGKPSVNISLVNGDEMASGSWKNPYTGQDTSSVFYKGDKGKSIFIKKGGKLIILLDRYEANAKYRFVVVFESGE